LGKFRGMILGLTMVAMLAFAANSLLARAGLGDGAIDAASFTAIRLMSGAVALAAVMAVQSGGDRWRRPAGSWVSALCLFGYAIAFSLAYLRLGAATGALVLFAVVQATMIGWGMVRRQLPSRGEVVGLAIAFAAFVWLLLPGLQAPDPMGAALMAVAGASWGVYSLRGRHVASALGDTAGNFARAGVVCLPLVVLGLLQGRASWFGVGLAACSGVVASGLGYAVWYRAVAGLRPIQAASVQLTVPVIAALGAVVVLSEALSVRLVIAGLCILGGVGLTLALKGHAVRQ
jgi:drug/metabolite transporter (DMT)-like permease